MLRCTAPIKGVGRAVEAVLELPHGEITRLLCTRFFGDPRIPYLFCISLLRIVGCHNFNEAFVGSASFLGTRRKNGKRKMEP